MNFQGEQAPPGSPQIVDWQWDFGDGATAVGQNTTHVYSRAAVTDVLEVVLRTTDENGLSGVRAVRLEDGPQADFGFLQSGYTITLGQAIEFDGGNTEGDVALWIWEISSYDAGVAETIVSPSSRASYTPTLPGQYDIAHRVIDNDGLGNSNAPYESVTVN